MLRQWGRQRRIYERVIVSCFQIASAIIAGYFAEANPPQRKPPGSYRLDVRLSKYDFLPNRPRLKGILYSVSQEPANCFPLRNSLMPVNGENVILSPISWVFRVFRVTAIPDVSVV